MPTVTAIAAQKKGKRVNVFLDGKFGFSSDLETVIKEKIKVGVEYSHRQLNEIIKKAEYAYHLERLILFATLRPRSEKEVKSWLIRKKVPPSLYETLTGKLSSLDLLNDEAFALWWVEQRLEFTQKSVKEIGFELKQKGIKDSAIEAALKMQEVDEVKIATKLIEKKLYRWERLGPVQKKQKISAFLLSKGYSWDTVKSVLNKLLT